MAAVGTIEDRHQAEAAAPAQQLGGHRPRIPAPRRWAQQALLLRASARQSSWRSAPPSPPHSGGARRLRRSPSPAAHTTAGGGPMKSATTGTVNRATGSVALASGSMCSRGSPQLLGRLQHRRGRGSPSTSTWVAPSRHRSSSTMPRGLDGTRGATAATAIPASKQVARSTPGAITTARRSVRPTPSRTRSPASPVHRRRQRPASDQRPIVSEQSRALGLADNGLKPPPARQNQGLGDGRREITKAASAQRRTRNSSIKL
jgi:hypothetical protein